MKTGTMTAHRTFGFSFQSSGTAILIFNQNSPIYQKKGVKIFPAMLCLYKQMRSLLDMKTLINMLISFLHQNHFLRSSSPRLLQSLPPALELPCHSRLKGEQRNRPSSQMLEMEQPGLPKLSKENPESLFDVNILLREKQTVHK